MAIWAIGDLHLSFDESFTPRKPMDIFGDKWTGHEEKIRESWLENVKADDFVLLSGDLSWAMDLEELKYDLEYLQSLPGQKILVKGNHDLWWQSKTKVMNFFSEDFHFIQNDHFEIDENLIICGTRGWVCPGDSNYSKSDEKIYLREVNRLKLSLDSVKDKSKEIIVMLHYPPTNMNHERSMFIDVLEEYGVRTCIYGHLHSKSINNCLPCEKWGINFYLTSCDALDFKLLKIR